MNSEKKQILKTWIKETVNSLPPGNAINERNNLYIAYTEWIESHFKEKCPETGALWLDYSRYVYLFPNFVKELKQFVRETNLSGVPEDKSSKGKS